MSFKLTGQREMKRKMKAIAVAMPGKIARGLYLEGEYIMTRSKRDHVPVDLGALKSSGHVQKPVAAAGVTSVKLVYGGSSAPYALAIHEHPSEYSPPSWEGVPVVFNPPGRGPKYLEKPFMAAITGMSERIAKGITP